MRGKISSADPGVSSDERCLPSVCVAVGVEFIEYAEKAETSFIVLSDIPGLIFSEVLTDNPSLLFREFVDERTVISCLEDW